MSMSGSVYFFRKWSSKSSFGVLRTPFSPPRTISLWSQTFYFSKLRLVFRFFYHCFLAISAFAMTRILSFTLDNCFFTDSRSSGIFLSPFLKSLCSTVSRPFFLYLLLTVCIVFHFWTSAAPKWSRQTACIILVKERNFTQIDPFKLFRRMKDNSLSSAFYLSSSALRQLMRIAFSFTLSALGWQTKWPRVPR